MFLLPCGSGPTVAVKERPWHQVLSTDAECRGMHTSTHLRLWQGAQLPPNSSKICQECADRVRHRWRIYLKRTGVGLPTPVRRHAQHKFAHMRKPGTQARTHTHTHTHKYTHASSLPLTLPFKLPPFPLPLSPSPCPLSFTGHLCFPGGGGGSLRKGHFRYVTPSRLSCCNAADEEGSRRHRRRRKCG